VKVDNRGAWKYGGFADIFRGEYNNIPIVVKRLSRLSASDMHDVHKVLEALISLCPRSHLILLQKVTRETLVWRQLKHRSILPFIGIDVDSSQASHIPSLISPWMSRGTLTEYMKSIDYHPEADAFRLVRPSILSS
jgi:serine/threonine protein kinase